MMKYATVSLSGVFRETQPQIKSLLPRGMGGEFRFDAFLLRLEALMADRKVGRVLVDCKTDFRPNYFAGAESVRTQLLRLREAGKEVLFYARDYGPTQMYLASGCSKALIHPLGRVRFLGLSRDFLFFKRLLDRVKVSVQVVRRGKYKSAMDSLRRDRIDAAQQEQHEALLECTMGELREKIKEGTGKTDRDIEALLAGRILTAAEAAEQGWVSEVKTREELLSEWEREKLKQARSRKLRNSFGRGRKVAVLVFEGAIVDGRSRRDPLLGQAIGSESYLPVIKKLTRDRSVRGVIFRINSGGGSAIASEEIASALARLREKKPLVVSMSEVAGSGGYWIAMHGERLFAEKTTVTGSIGVISAYVQADRLLQRLGITHSTIKRGELSDLGSVLRKPTRRENEIVEGMVEAIYRSFLEKVAASRGKAVEEVDRLGQGRIWSGADAARVGIVDQVGGIGEALQFMKERLKSRRIKVEFHPVVRYSLMERFIYQRRSLQVENAPDGWPESLALLGLGTSLLNGRAGEPLALMAEQLWLRSVPW
jgi:protease-4